MNIMSKARIYLFLLGILIIGVLYACGSPTPEVIPPPSEPPEAPVVSSPSEKPSGTPDRVDVVYFHRPQRCVTCICFEERISHVVKTYFRSELDSGKLTFQILNLGDEENAAIASKYGAIGSQLFINTVKDDIEHIRDIQEIWSWKCTKDEEGFDQAVKSVIEQSLRGEE